MMRTWLSTFMIIFLACNSKRERPVEPTQPERLTPQYYFFPKANVYFDSANKDYLFLSNDGHTWAAEKQIPAAMYSLMDKSVLLDSPATPVWKDNANHRLVYAAVLYATPQDTVEKVEPKPTPRTETAQRSDDKPARKGKVRRFFDKLFGKKEKGN